MNKKNKKNSFSNSVTKIGSSSKDAGIKIFQAIKDLPNLPWDKLPKERYIALIVALLGMIAIFIVFGILL